MRRGVIRRQADKDGGLCIVEGRPKIGVKE